MISILIATQNRPEYIRACIASITQSTYKNYEVLIADQSSNAITKTIIRSLHNTRIRYFHCKQRGKAKALNFLLAKAKGSIYTFTDDDCIVETAWLLCIHSFFAAHPLVGAVFGTVKPYQPNTHIHEVCPSAFESSKNLSITDPYIIHYESIGLGNNMSYRKSVIQNIGPFLPWLGPGAFGNLAGGEESEYIYRTLSHGHRLAHDPSITVYHDRWVSKEEEEILQSRYARGLYAFWFYRIVMEKNTRLFSHIQIKFRKRITMKIGSLIRYSFFGETHRTRFPMSHIIHDIYSFCVGACIGIIHGLGGLLQKNNTHM